MIQSRFTKPEIQLDNAKVRLCLTQTVKYMNSLVTT